MPKSTSNLSVDGQQDAVAAATAAKRKVAAATTHREQDALIVVVATTRKTLDEVRARERTAALTWEKEKTIARHLK
jgi:hypothetical protein